jgi:hypothetical protein
MIVDDTCPPFLTCILLITFSPVLLSGTATSFLFTPFDNIFIFDSYRLKVGDNMNTKEKITSIYFVFLVVITLMIYDYFLRNGTVENLIVLFRKDYIMKIIPLLIEGTVFPLYPIIIGLSLKLTEVSEDVIIYWDLFNEYAFGYYLLSVMSFLGAILAYIIGIGVVSSTTLVFFVYGLEIWNMVFFILLYILHNTRVMGEKIKREEEFIIPIN